MSLRRLSAERVKSMTKCVPFTFRNEKAFTLWMNRLPRKPVCEACGGGFTSKDTVKPRRLNSKYGAHTVHYHVGCYEAGMESVSVNYPPLKRGLVPEEEAKSVR